MKFNHKWMMTALAALCVLAPASMRAQQLHPSFGLDSDFDTKGNNFYGAGMYLGFPSKSAWSPYVSLYSYYLNYPAGRTRGSLKGFSPTVGLSHASGRSSVSFGAGYSFVTKNTGAPLNTGRGNEGGVTASFGAHNTGPGERPYKAEFLSNYNFGSDYLWTRARGSVPFGYSVAHPARIGLELGAQGSNHNGASSYSFSVGPTFEVRLTRQLGFTVAGGPKFYSNGGHAAYIGLALSINP